MNVTTIDLASVLAGKARQERCVVALGTFDGVHCGHVEILHAARRLAARLQAVCIALTFDRLPLELLQPELAPPLLTSHPVRLALLARHVDQVLVVTFNAELAALTPVDFVTDVLATGLHCVGIVAGFNFTFGKGAAGSVADLQAIGSDLGLGVSVVPPVRCAGRQVSSTLIRQMISAGDVTTAAALLGRPFALEGRVGRGDARGRELGFPTANVQSDPRLIVPADGAYITEVWHGGTADADAYRIGYAVTGISNRPTFAGTGTSVESHIIDYSGDLYNAAVHVRFIKRLRGIVHFQNAGELQKQIGADVAAARTHFGL